MASVAITSTPQVTPHLATSEILFRKLLVAVDFSKQTSSVLKAALAIAKAYQAEIVLVSATSPVVYGTGAEPVPIETFEMNLDIAKEQMDTLIANEPGLQEAKHSEVVAYARPLDLVQQIVQEEQIDLIVAGSHGASGLERLALGSVAESILRHVSCPVLIVGPHAKPSESPFRSLLLTTDLKVETLRAAQYATGLAERFHSKLTLLHVVEPKSQAAHGQPDTYSLEALLPPDLSTYGTASLCVECGEADKVIARVATRECASLIVAGVGEHALADHAPWSTLGQIIRESHCPVLCVRHNSAIC